MFCRAMSCLLSFVWIQNYVLKAVKVEILEALFLKTGRQNVALIMIFRRFIHSFQSETTMEPLRTDIFLLPVVFHVQELVHKKTTYIKS